MAYIVRTVCAHCTSTIWPVRAVALPTQITNYSTLRRHCALNITIIVTVAIIIKAAVYFAGDNVTNFSWSDQSGLDDESFTADNASDILILPIVLAPSPQSGDEQDWVKQWLHQGWMGILEPAPRLLLTFNMVEATVLLLSWAKQRREIQKLQSGHVEWNWVKRRRSMEGGWKVV